MSDRAHVVQIDVEGWLTSCANEVLERVVAGGGWFMVECPG